MPFRKLFCRDYAEARSEKKIKIKNSDVFLATLKEMKTHWSSAKIMWYVQKDSPDHFVFHLNTISDMEMHNSVAKSNNL